MRWTRKSSARNVRVILSKCVSRTRSSVLQIREAAYRFRDPIYSCGASMRLVWSEWKIGRVLRSYFWPWSQIAKSLQIQSTWFCSSSPLLPDSFVVVVFPTFAKFILFSLSLYASSKAFFRPSNPLSHSLSPTTISARLVTQIRVTTRTRKKGVRVEAKEARKKAKVLPKMARKKMGMDSERKRKEEKSSRSWKRDDDDGGGGSGAEFDHFNIVLGRGK